MPHATSPAAPAPRTQPTAPTNRPQPPKSLLSPRACPVDAQPVEQLVELRPGEDTVNVCKGYTQWPRGSDDLETKVRGL
jgi:hypothetical protein